MNKNISQIVLDKIKERGEKPISKSVFYFKKYLFWFLVGLSIVIGSISFAIALSFLINNDWNLYGRFGFSFILKTLPYFWFICLALFIFLGEFYYKKTFLGYRHRSFVIVGIYLLTTTILGSIIYSIRMEENIERSLHRKIPVYRTMVFDREDIWAKPNEGLLSGEIILDNDNRLQIIDNRGLLWEVKINEDTFIGRRVNLIEGERIKILGEIEDRRIFKAQEIRPWINNMGKMNIPNNNLIPKGGINRIMR